MKGLRYYWGYRRIVVPSRSTTTMRMVLWIILLLLLQQSSYHYCRRTIVVVLTLPPQWLPLAVVRPKDPNHWIWTCAVPGRYVRVVVVMYSLFLDCFGGVGIACRLPMYDTTLSTHTHLLFGCIDSCFFCRRLLLDSMFVPIRCVVWRSYWRRGLPCAFRHRIGWMNNIMPS